MSIKRLAALAAAMLFLTACGGTTTPGTGGGTSGGSMSVSVSEPAEGATVSVPFTVKVNSSVPLGATSSGLHHVHIWFDDKSDDYVVVESDTTQITAALAAGAHTMHLSLRNADHSAAGAESQVSLTVGAGGSGTPSSSPSAPAETSTPY